MTRDVTERFWSKVDKTGDCWLWTASVGSHGYGQMTIAGRPVTAHRYSAMFHFGMFDRRSWVLHTCDERRCVRPSHLYLGDRQRNIQDMVDRGRSFWRQKTHCPHGHAYEGDNVYQNPGSSSRVCRECHRNRAREYQRAVRAKRRKEDADD